MRESNGLKNFLKTQYFASQNLVAEKNQFAAEYGQRPYFCPSLSFYVVYTKQTIS